MRAALLALAHRVMPQLRRMRGREHSAALANVVGVFYSAPFALAGLIWLGAVTDLSVLRREGVALLIPFALLFVFAHLDFFIFFEVTPGTYADWTWTLAGVITWSTVLMFGPSALWLTVLWEVTTFARKWMKADVVDWRWNLVRNLCLNVATVIFGGLVAIRFYEAWGGAFPLPGLALHHLLPAFGAVFVWFLVATMAYAPLIAYFSLTTEYAWGSNNWWTFARYLTMSTGWHLVVDPFAILMAGLYVQHGMGGYLFFVAALLLMGFIAHQLSEAVEHNQLRSRELEKLGRLGQAMLNMPPDACTLPKILDRHLCNMFPFSHIELRLFPEQTVAHHPDDWDPVAEVVWSWLKLQEESHYFLPGERTPWDVRLEQKGIIVTPIVTPDSQEAIGGIYLERFRTPQTIIDFLPALQSLADQIASALHRAEVYRQTLELQRAEQELALAGSIQATFLPDELPRVRGWQITASLEPARETSGDYYDIFPLPNGHLALVIADVADKGVGAALYMALSRTLIRTYAVEYHGRPDFVMRVTNRRILMDTDAGLFVTVFYGTLDPATGRLTYCNAGHNPPYIIREPDGNSVKPLTRTGMALGVIERTDWGREWEQLAPGELLVLYTDGITEAQNRHGAFFERERLLQLLQANAGRSAAEVQGAILEAVHAFTGGAVQSDDITVMVIEREEE
jgi:serine phosphatase RsbU (regulator of sigma subunit)